MALFLTRQKTPEVNAKEFIKLIHKNSICFINNMYRAYTRYIHKYIYVLYVHTYIFLLFIGFPITYTQ